ncbi:MAG: YccF domain-containing protein [Deltaproteobacteria bacterium]|nr:MAG: YccF domain-containing protein [Deltaproteobacteria bacterium]
MTLIGNILWLIFGGLITAAGWFVAGLLVSLTVIGIPFGLQCFKIARLVLLPFGREVKIGNFGAGGFLANLLWVILLGWELCLAHLVSAATLAVTIIGIPFALQHLKLAKLSLLPFGAEIEVK